MTGSTEPDGPFLLNVEFDDGTKDVAELFPYRYNDSAMEKGILQGDLRNEDPTVEVAVNGQPGDNTFDITMHSKHHEGGVYQVKDGKTYEVTQDKCLADGHVEMSEKNDGVYNN